MIVEVLKPMTVLAASEQKEKEGCPGLSPFLRLHFLSKNNGRFHFFGKPFFRFPSFL